MKIICEENQPNPLTYLDVYEEGDMWVKIQGCEACPLENRKKCCGDCPMFTDKGCYFHLGNLLNKPYRCVINPVPSTCLSWCALEFECTEGSKKGLVRRIRDKGNEFVSKEKVE